jgi:hypothetical protein
MTGRIAYVTALTLTLLTGLTGCGDGGAPEKESDQGGKGGKGGKAAQEKPGKPDDAKEPANTASPSESSGPGKAADGTDTGACADADCEVELSKGSKLRPDSSYGINEFRVQSIKKHVITWTAVFDGGRVSMSAQGGENSSTSCTNGTCFGSIGKSEGKLQMNDVTVEFTSIGDNSAVAEVSHKK